MVVLAGFYDMLPNRTRRWPVAIQVAAGFLGEDLLHNVVWHCVPHYGSAHYVLSRLRAYNDRVCLLKGTH